MKMCHAFADMGHSVTLVNLTVSNNIGECEEAFQYYGLPETFRILSLRIPHPRGPWSYVCGLVLGGRATSQALGACSPDMVVGRYLPGCSVAAALGNEVIFESHAPVWGSLVNRILFSWIRKKKNLRKVIVITESLKRAYVDRYLDTKLGRKIVVAPDAADVVERESHPTPIIRTNKVLQIGYSGHLYKGKGVDLIVDLAKLMPEVEFHVFGGFEDDLERYSGTGNLTFYGFIRHGELGKYISQLDIGLAPIGRRMYGFGSDSLELEVENIAPYTSPLKIFEYMAYGLPIIASNLPAIAEVISPDIGILADPDDLAEWKEAINMLKNKELRDKMGACAQKLQREKYSWLARAETILA